jgi:hypothetical protein
MEPRYIQDMKNHRIVHRDGAYRIEVTTGFGGRQLLAETYPTRKAVVAHLRALRALRAIDKALLLERQAPKHQVQDAPN